MYLDPINNLLSPMFFNYDSFELVAIGFVASGVFLYSYFNSSPTINNESLVNTLSTPDLSNNCPSQLIDAAVQTDTNIQVEASVQAATTYVNTGMQTSARMWLESIRNWITEILVATPNPNPNYVDVGVQTNTISTWQTVKDWFRDVCSVRSSELSSLGRNKVAKWRNNLDSIQSVNHQDSESPLTNIGFGSPNNSTLDNLVDPNDSASNISEVVSESALLNLNELPAVSDILNVAATNYVDTITDPTILAVWMSVPPLGV